MPTLKSAGVGLLLLTVPTHARSQSAQPPAAAVPRTTDSDPAVRAAPNRLLGQPAPTAPNRVWVGDITYWPR